MFARWPVNSMFFMKKSYGSMPIAAAASSSAVIVIAHACGWAGARQARALPMLLERAVCCFRWFGMLKIYGKGGEPPLPCPPVAHDCDSHAVIVPSFLRPTLTWA